MLLLWSSTFLVYLVYFFELRPRTWEYFLGIKSFDNCFLDTCDFFEREGKITDFIWMY